MVVNEITGLVKVKPVPKDKPPVGFAYQCIVPPLEVAPRVTAPDPQILLGVVPVIEGIVLIVAITAVLEAVVHNPLVAST